MTVKIPKLNNPELKILLLLDEGRMHVRALRAELDDFGSISRYLLHLEDLGFIRREKVKTRIVNILTLKGERAAKALRVLRS
jgi:DNA-binding HxlR family transcriptional regulator